jgi:hypothetical protein
MAVVAPRQVSAPVKIQWPPSGYPILHQSLHDVTPCRTLATNPWSLANPKPENTVRPIRLNPFLKSVLSQELIQVIIANVEMAANAWDAHLTRLMTLQGNTYKKWVI